MRKGKRIALIVTISLLAVIIIITSTVFRLHDVRVEYRTDKDVMTSISDKQIIDASEIHYGRNLLFLDIHGYEQKLESAFPYIQVVKFQRQFPNKVVIYLAERIPVFRVEDPNIQNEWVVYDKDLKILNASAFESLSPTEKAVPALNTGELKNLFKGELTPHTITISTFFNNPVLRGFAQAVAGAFNSGDRELSLVSDIVIDEVTCKDYFTFKFLMKGTSKSVIIETYGHKTELMNRIAQGFAIYKLNTETTGLAFDTVLININGQATSSNKGVPIP